MAFLFLQFEFSRAPSLTTCIPPSWTPYNPPAAEFMTRFIKNIQVQATDSAATGDGRRLREIYGRGDDINKSFRGK